MKCYVLQVDTKISEQTLAWLTKYGKTTRHVNQHRFFFYILNACDLKNHKIKEALNIGKKRALVLALLATVIMQMTE